MTTTLAVIPVLIGPLQVLLALLPAILAAVATVAASLLKPRTLLAMLRLAWRLKMQLAAFALCVWGAVWGLRQVRPHSPGGHGGAAVLDGDWAMFRGNPRRTGFVPSSPVAPGPTRGGVVWRRGIDGAVFYASPAVAGNRLYISSSEGIGPFDREGRGAIYGLDTDTGALVWSFSPRFETGARRYRATFSSPVVKGGRLVCGEGLHETKNCRVICLDIADETNVKLAWSVETDNHVECTPIVGTVRIEGADGATRTEDRVFVGNGDTGGYLCLALASGEVLWHVRGERYLDAETALLYHDNRVYAGLGNDGKALCVLDAVTGAELGRVETGYPVFSPPAIAEGTLYVGMGNGDFVYRASELGLPAQGEVWAVAVTAGADGRPSLDVRWKVRLSETVLGAVSVGGERVCFATADGTVCSVDRATGGDLRQWSSHGAIKSSPAVTESHVYVVTADGRLFALDAANLAPVWECRVGGGEQNFSSPAVARGRVYVGTAQDGIVCAGASTEPGPEVWSGRLGGAGQGGNPGGASLPRAGRLGWNFPSACAGEPAVAAITAPVAVSGGRLVVPIARRHDGALEPGLLCIAPRDRAAAPAEPLWQLRLTNGVHLSPAVVAATVFVVDGVPGDTGRRLRAVNGDDGSELWAHAVADEAAGAFVAAADGVWTADASNRLTRLDLDGKIRWAAVLPGRIAHAPTVTSSLAIQPVAEPNRVVVMDRDSGRRLLDAPLGAPPVATACAAGRVVYVPTAGGVAAVDLVTGGTPAGWRGVPAAPTTDLVLADRHIAFIDADARLVVLDADTGMPVGDPVAGAAPGSVPMPVAGPAGFLYADADGALRRVHLGRDGVGTPAPWIEDTAALGGAPCSPLVLAESGIYAAWPGWGLLRLEGAK